MRAGTRSARARLAVGMILLAGLLAVAGCGELADPVGPGPTPTVSPAPIPTVSPAGSGSPGTVVTRSSAAPTIPVSGVSVVDDGVRVNATRLGRAHERALDRAGSYRRTVAVSLRTEDGTVVTEDRERVLADRDAGRYLIAGTPRLAPGPFDEPVGYERFVANGTRHTYRRFANGTTRVGRTAAASPPRGRWRVSGRELATLLSRADLRAASRGDAGAPDRYVLVGRIPDPPTFGLVSETADGRVTASVRADGLVKGLRLTYRARSGRQPIAVVLAVEHDRLGETVVDRPAWIDDPGTNGSRDRGTSPATLTAGDGTVEREPTDRTPQSLPVSSSSRVRRWR